MTGRISGGDTHKLFFHRVLRGIHERIGEEVRRDEPLTIGITKEVHRILEKEWVAETRRRKPPRSASLRIALTGYWFIVGFCSWIEWLDGRMLEIGS